MHNVLLCLRKSWSDGPIWGWAVAPELPSRGSSWSQGGTAPTTHTGHTGDNTFKTCNSWADAVKCMKNSDIKLFFSSATSLFHIHPLLYLYEHFHCLLSPAKNKHLWVQGEGIHRIKNITQLGRNWKLSSWRPSVYLITNECQALSSCPPLCFQSRVVEGARRRLLKSLKRKLRAIPEKKR